MCKTLNKSENLKEIVLFSYVTMWTENIMGNCCKVKNTLLRFEVL